MDTAHDAVLARRLSAPRPGSRPARLATCLDHLVGVIATAPAGGVPGHSSRPYADAVRRVADAVEAGAPLRPVPLPPVPAAPGARALHAAVADLAAPDTGTVPGPDIEAPRGPLSEASQGSRGGFRRVPVPAPAGRRFGSALLGRLREPAARRYSLRLTGCMAAAQAVASVSGLPRSGWLVLTVALIMRPGLGTVPARFRAARRRHHRRGPDRARRRRRAAPGLVAPRRPSSP